MRLSVSEHTSSPAISWKRNLYAIWIAEFIAIIGFNTSVPIIPFYLQDLGIHDPQKLKIWVGISQALVSVAVAIFAPIWGKVADIYGRKPMLLRAM
ncbi:MAG TPA: MFS transporter, partial [Spirochaetia bacterium]|nr:MFS transporter [Spirochaetia bacterium]